MYDTKAKTINPLKMNTINGNLNYKLIRFIKARFVYEAKKCTLANSKQLVLSYLKTYLFAEKMICKQLYCLKDKSAWLTSGHVTEFFQKDFLTTELTQS